MEALGADLQVRKATPEQHASVPYDDILVDGMRCARGESSIVFEGGVFRDEHLLVSGKLAHVVAGASTQTSRFAAHALRAVFDAIAGGSDSNFAVRNGGSGYWRRWVGAKLSAWFRSVVNRRRHVLSESHTASQRAAGPGHRRCPAEARPRARRA